MLSAVVLHPAASYALPPITSLVQDGITVQVRNMSGGPVAGNQYCRYADGSYGLAAGQVKIVSYSPGPTTLAVDNRSFDINGAQRITATSYALVQDPATQGFSSLQFLMPDQTGWITTPAPNNTSGYSQSINRGRSIIEAEASTHYVIEPDVNFAIATSNVEVATNPSGVPQMRVKYRQLGTNGVTTASLTHSQAVLYGLNQNELVNCEERLPPPIFPSVEGKQWTYLHPVSSIYAVADNAPIIQNIVTQDEVNMAKQSFSPSCAFIVTSSWNKQYITPDKCFTNNGATSSVMYGQYHLRAMNAKFNALLAPTSMMSAAEKRQNILGLVKHGANAYWFWNAARQAGNTVFVDGNGGHNMQVNYPAAYVGLITNTPEFINTSYAATGMRTPMEDQYVRGTNPVTGQPDIAFRHNPLSPTQYYVWSNRFADPDATINQNHYSMNYAYCCTITTRSTGTAILKVFGASQLFDPTGVDREITQRYGLARPLNTSWSFESQGVRTIWSIFTANPNDNLYLWQ